MFMMCVLTAGFPVSTVATAFTIGSLLCLIPTGAFALFMLYGGYERLKKKRLLENVPTSKIAGVTFGLNEVKGKAIGDPPMKAPLSDEDAVFYMYRVEEHKKHAGDAVDGDWSADPEASENRSMFDVAHLEGQDNFEADDRWTVLDYGKKVSQFYLEDDTGRIRVRPTTKSLVELDSDFLTVDLIQFLGEPTLDHTCGPDDPMFYEKGPPDRSERKKGKRRFREWTVPHGGDVYVMGPVRVREDIVEPEMAADPDLVGMDHQFFLSTDSETDLGKRYFRDSSKNYGCALPFLVFTSWIYVAIGTVGGWSSIVVPNIFVATGLAVGGWGMGIAALYLKTVYDGLVELRHRVDRSWAMLDVELKRRHDLIPRLVEIVEAMAGHEQQLHKAATKARATGVPSAGDTPQAGRKIDEQTAALDGIFAIAEDYPDIKADRHFQTLMEELSRSEKKIALARQFYNDSVERLNNRVGTIPDIFVAPLARAKKGEFLSFEEFEKKPIDIELIPDEETSE